MFMVTINSMFMVNINQVKESTYVLSIGVLRDRENVVCTHNSLLISRWKRKNVI